MNREDFPMLQHGYVYFNNAATTFKPKKVIDALVDYYENYSVNMNRGVDSLGYQVAQKYEDVRLKIAKLFNARKDEIVFTKGTTEGINLTAQLLKKQLKASDEILISDEEHHAVYVTMQQLAKKCNCVFKVVPFEKVVDNINENTKIVAISQKTNVLGKKSDLKAIAKLKTKFEFYFVVDGAQGILYEMIDVKKLAIDFYAFSAHKFYGPLGVGVLYINNANDYEPVLFGGEMVLDVTYDLTNFKKAPAKFEAGTMMIPEVIAMDVAIDYFFDLGYEKVNKHIKELRKYLLVEMKKMNDIIIYNEKEVDSGIITFNVKDVHAHDIATFFDKHKIIMRAGHHCAQPLMAKMNVSATLRLSLALYNNKEECEKFLQVLMKRGDYVDAIF